MKFAVGMNEAGVFHLSALHERATRPANERAATDRAEDLFLDALSTPGAQVRIERTPEDRNEPVRFLNIVVVSEDGR